MIINLVIFFFSKKNLSILQKNKIKLNKIDLSILILLIIILISNFSQFDLSDFVAMMRLFLIIIFSLFVYFDQDKQKIVLRALFFTIVWQSFLAYYHFFQQQSFAPYFVWGETNLNDLILVSRGQFFLQEKILPYGTTAHPNILAGMLTIFSIIIINKKNTQPLVKLLLFSNALLIIFFTQSFSAFLSLLMFIIYVLIKKIFKQNDKLKIISINWQKHLTLTFAVLLIAIPLIIQVLDQHLAKNYLSISRRAMLNRAAWQMFLDHPFFGLGFNNFVKEVENYSQHYELVRFVQPVHHGGLLLISESGLVGLGLLLCLIFRFRKKINWPGLLILTPIISLDHYLITQPLGLMILILLIIFFR